MKYGIANEMVRKMNDKHFRINPIPAFAEKEVSAKILLFHVLAVPISERPARPSVQIPITAALRFWRHLKYSFSGMKTCSDVISGSGDEYWVGQARSDVTEILSWVSDMIWDSSIHCVAYIHSVSFLRIRVNEFMGNVMSFSYERPLWIVLPI